MTELARVQRAVYEALRETSGASCFVRLCASDDALWVTDLPRRTESVEAARKALDALGVTCTEDGAAGLWRLDWTREAWRGRLLALPAKPPPFPRDEALHPAYALCRLLLLHPTPLERQPMEQVRAVCKRASGAPEALLRLVSPLHGESARRLRAGEPVAYGAGQVLSDWLTRTDRPNE